MVSFQYVSDGVNVDQVICRTDDDGRREFIAADPSNTDYRLALAEIEAGANVLPPDPEPEPQPSRDARLLAAVDGAKSEVTEAVKAGVFTREQAVALASVFDKLGQAISGGSA